MCMRIVTKSLFLLLVFLRPEYYIQKLISCLTDYTLGVHVKNSRLMLFKNIIVFYRENRTEHIRHSALGTEC
jgi:hypothetical protein